MMRRRVRECDVLKCGAFGGQRSRGGHSDEVEKQNMKTNPVRC